MVLVFSHLISLYYCYIEITNDKGVRSTKVWRSKFHKMGHLVSVL